MGGRLAAMALAPFGLLSDDVLLHLLVRGGVYCVIQATKLDRRMKEVCNAELKRRFDQVEFLTRDPFGMSRNLCLELQFGECTDLNLSSRDISSSHMSEFSSAVASGALASLEELDLNDNQICEEGMKLFFTAVSSGALASLTFLRLDENQIGDTGMIAFADAI